eukprot:670385-Pleurochrysis_carterae.AAC.1
MAPHDGAGACGVPKADAWGPGEGGRGAKAATAGEEETSTDAGGGETDAIRGDQEATGGRAAARGREGRERGGPTPRHVLVVFAGDGTAESTLPGELRRRGHRVTAIDVALGGAEHDVLRGDVAGRLLEEIRGGTFDA